MAASSEIDLSIIPNTTSHDHRRESGLGEHATIEGNVRRRNVGRIDGLGYLAPTESTDPPTSAQMNALCEVASYIMWINVCGQDVLVRESDELPYPPLSVLKEFEGALSVYERELRWSAYNRLFESGTRIKILDHMSAEPFHQVLRVIMTQKICQYYGDIFRVQLNVLDALNIIVQLTEKRAFDNDEEKEDRILRSVSCLNEGRYLATRLLRIIRGLRDSIQKAAKESFLTEDLLVALKARLEPFQDQYAQLCEAVSMDSRFERSLIDLSSREWWIPSEECKAGIVRAPNKPAEVYPTSSRMRSTLNVIIPIIAFLAVVPAALAWENTKNLPGTTRDSDFYQTIAGSMMQLLSLVTLVRPTLSHLLLSHSTRVWIWVLAGFSAICALVSMALYPTVSSMWSFVIGFAGVLAQVIVQLQLIDAI